MNLEKINYLKLSAKQQEIYNFQKVAGELADYGYNCIKLADDWQGADFLAYHKDGTETLKVQLKGRLTICKKYIGKSLYMAFPCKGGWYLIEHDLLVEYAEQHTTWLRSKSWKNEGLYSTQSPNQKMMSAIFASLL